MKSFKIAMGMMALGALVLAPLNANAAVSQAAKVLLHIRGTTSKNQCVVPVASCDVADNTGDLNALYFMLVVVDQGDSLFTAGSGLAGVQFGVTYPGVFNGTGGGSMINVFSWIKCATLEFASGNFPAPGGGNLITWSTDTVCQTTRLACPGYFYLSAYDAGTFSLVKRFVDNTAAVADCNAKQINLSSAELGSAAFSMGGTAPACNPCLVACSGVPVLPTTWSSIKALSNQ